MTGSKRRERIPPPSWLCSRRSRLQWRREVTWSSLPACGRRFLRRAHPARGGCGSGDTQWISRPHRPPDKQLQSHDFSDDLMMIFCSCAEKIMTSLKKKKRIIIIYLLLRKRNWAEVKDSVNSQGRIQHLWAYLFIYLFKFIVGLHLPHCFSAVCKTASWPLDGASSPLNIRQWDFSRSLLG